MSAFPLVTGQYGFDYGPLRVVRMHSDEKHGVWINVSGAREQIEIRVTKGGRLRVSEVRPTDYRHAINDAPAPEPTR